MFGLSDVFFGRESGINGKAREHIFIYQVFVILGGKVYNWESFHFHIFYFVYSKNM